MNDPNPTPEQWRDIPGFTGYQVSDLGRVRSYRRRGRGRSVDPARDPRILRPAYINDYASVNIRRDGSPRPTTTQIHRLMALAFKPIPDPDDNYVVHLDGNRRNNRLSNIDWQSRNPRSISNDERHLIPPLTSIVRYIRSNPTQRYHFVSEITAHFGISAQAIMEAMRQIILHGDRNLEGIAPLQFDNSSPVPPSARPDNLAPSTTEPPPTPTESESVTTARANLMRRFYEQNPDAPGAETFLNPNPPTKE